MFFKQIILLKIDLETFCVFSYLAMVLYHAGDMAGAIMQQHKELIINERCLGLDHPDTAHRYQFSTFYYLYCLKYLIKAMFAS